MFVIPCSIFDIPLMPCPSLALLVLRLVRRSFSENGSWFLRSLGEGGWRRRIAIETGKSNIKANVRKCKEAGFDNVVVVRTAQRQNAR